MSTRFPAAVGALLVAAAVAWGGGDDAPKMVWRLADGDGVKATTEEVLATVRVLTKRFNSAGLAGIRLTPSDDGRITVELPADLAPRAESVWKLAERTGTLEFRIQASAAEERDLREVRDLAAPPRPDRSWVPRREGGPDMLVLTPEKPFLAALQKLDDAHVAHDEPEYVTARKAYDDAVRAEVFGTADFARAEVRHNPWRRPVVFFALKDDRKDAFASFTERHVKENLAIVLDGQVQSAPAINGKLPGEAVIEGGGENGFSETEAAALAAVLNSGALPGRLVREPAPEKK